MKYMVSFKLFVYMEKSALLMIKLLGANIQTKVAWVTKHVGFVDLCLRLSIYEPRMKIREWNWVLVLNYN